jgi:phage-related protein
MITESFRNFIVHLLSLRHKICRVTGLIFDDLPTTLGTIPTILGTIPTILGTIPTILGTIPTILSTIPTILGTIPIILSTIPTSSQPRWTHTHVSH